MSSGKVKCTCGWSWNKSDSSAKDMYICHECGRDNSNNMKNGGWLDKHDVAQEGEVLYTPPKSQYKRLYGHGSEYGVGENKNMRIDPDTGYSYFPPELSINQKKEVPDSPWNISRFLFDPFIKNVSQGLHNAKYTNEGEYIDSPGDVMEQGHLANNLSRRERYNAAKKDITNYYKEDLKLNDDEVEKKVDDTMDLIRKMRRTEEMMQRHNASYTDFQNPEEVFKRAVGFYGDDNQINPSEAKRAYKMFQKTWRGTSGKEARQNSREELRKAEEAFKLAKKQKEEGLLKPIKPDPNYVPEDFANGGILKNGGWLDSYADGGTMQEHQENYNNSQASAPEGMVGDGFSNVGRNYSPAWGGQFQMGGNVYPVNYVPQAQNGKNKKKKGVQDLLRDVENSVNKSLGYPMGKAATAAEQLAGKWYNPKTKQWEENDAVDNFRHPMAGRYASEAIQDKLYNIPVLSQIAGMVGSNALGVGHELSTLFHPKDKRGWYDKIRESGEDIFNNAVGATVGSLPISDKEKTNMLVKLSNKNMIPDGVSGKGGDMYIKHAMGGSIPGAVGFTYARVGGAPSNGPYAKKTMASAQNGQEMKFYQEGLDWKPKTISRQGSVIKDDRGQLAHPHQVTEISGDTMITDGYGYIPLYVVPDKGDPRMVYPNTGTHTFPGATKFTEYPVAQGGEILEDEKTYVIPESNLEEVVVEPSEFSKYRMAQKKIIPWEQFANERYLGNFERNMGQTLENLPEYRKQEYDDYINKLAFNEYVKTHPQAKGEKRGAYIDRIQKLNEDNQVFERAYEANAEYNPSTDVNIWRKGLMGLGSLVMGAPAINKLKQNSDYFSTKEKQHIGEHPIASAFDTTLGTLAPLEIPGNMLYGENNGALEALSGRGTDVPMEARILGDPLMVIGEGAPLIGKGFGYLGSKGSQLLAKASEASAPTLNRAKTLFDDMGAVMAREIKTIDPKLNAISDAESAIYQSAEYSKFADENLKLRQQKWALEGKVNQLKNKGRTAELNNLNDRISKLNKRIDVAEQFTVNGDGLVQSGKDTALGLKTGSTDIMDLATGEKFPISTSVPSQNVVHKLEGDKVVRSIDNSTLPQASPEYHATVKKNIDFIETQIPGAKVFGSAKNVAETEIPHIVGDYDVLMSQTQYDKFAKANPSVGNNGFAELHNIPGAAKGVDPIDINIIQEKGGKAIGTRAEELFKQVAPDEYYAAAKKAIKNKSDIKIPYSSQELVDMTNPTTKSVIDAYESSKGKHINKIDALINYGKPSVVAEGQQQFVNSLVGSKGSIGHQFPLEQLSNRETNAEILDKIGFIGNKDLVAADPQRMQIAINDYYMNNSILARQVDKDKISKIEAAIKEYNPNAKGGAVNGIGQNHVTLGFPHHGENNILSWKQLGMDLDTTDPMAYINSIEHQTSGEKLFSQEERAILSDIVKDMKFYDHEKQLAEGSENASQLLENLPYSEEGKKALYEFGKRTNRTMAKKSTNYGNSNITMTFRDFDDAIDIMQYQLINSEYSKNPVKSFMKRTQTAENAMNSRPTISSNMELLPKQFKAIKGYVEGGIDKANQRLVTLNAERTKISDDITALSDKLYNKKYKDELDRLNAFRTKIDKEITDMNQMRRDLHDRKIRLRDLEEKMKTVGILGGGGAALIGVGTYGYKKEMESRKEFNERLKNMTEKEREQFDKDLEERIRKADSLERTDKSSSDKFMDWFMGKKQNGGNITKAKNGNQLVKLDQLTNFTNYNKPQPGGWLNKYN